MANAMGANAGADRQATVRQFAALLLGNVALALGPWSVRLADTGPVSAAFWRLALAVPVLLLLARWSGQRLTGFGKPVWIAIAVAGFCFALDIGFWHIGIGLTRMANASLFGNSGSVVMMVWGLIALHRAPHAREWLALAAALGGGAILMGRSLEIDHATLIGDLFCIAAGLLYSVYLIALQHHRAELGAWSLLSWSSIAGLPVLLGMALWLGEPVWPTNWGPVVVLALLSQLIGQGLLVYSLRHFSALVIGLALLTQPAVAVTVGWLVFGEVLGPMDFAGMVLVAGGLVLARSTQR